MKSEIKEELLNNFKGTIFEKMILIDNKPLFDKAINNEVIAKNITTFFTNLAKENKDEKHSITKHDYKDRSFQLDIFISNKYFNINVNKLGIIEFTVNNAILKLNSRGNIISAKFKKNELNDYIDTVCFKVKKNECISDEVTSVKYELSRQRKITVYKENNEVKMTVSNKHLELKNEISNLDFIDKDFLLNNGYIKPSDKEISHLINDKDIVMELTKKDVIKEQQNALKRN